MSKARIIEGTELKEFFRDRVQRAIASQAIQASELSEFYLVNLLEEFRRAEKLFTEQGTERSEKTLALLLLEAMEGDTATRTRCLKELGDTALYVAGFFADNINRRRLVDQGYYVSMGGSAYGSLAAILSREKTFAELFGELSEKFSAFVDVIAAVSPWSEATTDANLIRLYEKWLSTGDERIEELLRRQGIRLDTTFQKIIQ